MLISDFVFDDLRQECAQLEKQVLRRHSGRDVHRVVSQNICKVSENLKINGDIFNSLMRHTECAPYHKMCCSCVWS